MKFTLVHLLSVATMLLGVAMVVQAIAGGGGIGAYGVLLGAFFIAAGFMRLRLMQARDKAEREQ